jgi:tetratricopeptide (TPR) repeat protein
LLPQLQEGAAGVFGPAAGTAANPPAVDVKSLHAKIGELTNRWQERGEIYTRQGKYQLAISDISEAIRLDSTPRAFRFHSRAEAYLGLRDLNRAIADFSEAIRLDPVARVFRFSGRGNALRDAGQYDRALVDYETALKLDPTNAWLFLERGRAYARAGQPQLAANDFKTALKIDPSSEDLRRAIETELGGLEARSLSSSPEQSSPQQATPVQPGDKQKANTAGSGLDPSALERELARLRAELQELQGQLAVLSPSGPQSAFKRLVGEWNHISSGETILVRQNGDAWSTAGPQARVRDDIEAGGNFAFEGRSASGSTYRCVYYINFLEGKTQTNWRLHASSGDAKCPSGIYALVDNSDAGNFRRFRRQTTAKQGKAAIKKD